MKNKSHLFFLLLLPLFSFVRNNKADGNFQIAILKYNGGGDWYANLETSVPNLIRFCNEKLKMKISNEQAIVEAGSTEIYKFPLVHMTGHGNVIFSDAEAQNLRRYLSAGGFLHISDNYVMDQFIRPQLKKIFPELDLIEVPFSHPIYHQAFDFPNGLPKIHEHDNKAPKGLGLFLNGKLICFYDYECDLGDGWENYEIHKDSQETREKALKMGANILSFAFLKNNPQK